MQPISKISPNTSSIQREEERDLTRSYDESPLPTEKSTTNRLVQHKNATKILIIH